MDDHFGLKALDQGYQFGYIFSVYCGSADVLVSGIALYIVDNDIALGLGAAGYQDFGEDFRLLSAFVDHYPAYPTRANDEHFGHFSLVFNDECELVFQQAKLRRKTSAKVSVKRDLS